MNSTQSFQQRLQQLKQTHEELCSRPNKVDERWNNGWYRRYVNPVVTAAHVPLDWRYDLNPETNPRLLERLGVNAAFNPGAIYHNGKYKLVVRVEGFDRKSFFALAESDNGVDGFRFVGEPLEVGEDPDNPETNVYDMRLTRHEDGWIYGVYCVERRDPSAPPGDLSSAVAQCAIVRTHDLQYWERIGEVKTPSRQQRNVVLHPEFVNGDYAFYTRPQDTFISAGSGGGIGFGLVESIEDPVITDQRVFEPRVYHTIKEVKNGMGGTPIKTRAGWLHIAHGVRECAWGLRYVLYGFLCDLEDPARVIAAPGGYFAAPFEGEYIGDVGNVLFTNGLVEGPDGRLLIYYASADTRCHVLETDVETILDYMLNTPPDALRSHQCVLQRKDLIRRNRALNS